MSYGKNNYIAFSSWSLAPAKKKYSQLEKDGISVIKPVAHGFLEITFVHASVCVYNVCVCVCLPQEHYTNQWHDKV